ncbi:MAG: class II glutamine amidotransferase [Candidatus Parvarchaeota archaeon]
MILEHIGDNMCRMGFVSSEKIGDFTDYVRNASIFYSHSNSDGFGLAFMNNNNNLNLVKYPGSAYDFFGLEGKDLNILCNSVIFHCRSKTSGSLDINSTHPFIDKNTGIAISHNGILYDYDDMKQELISKGYSFNSNVDSEILLYAYIEYKDEFINKMKQKGVWGRINLIIFDSKDSSIRIYSDDGSFRYIDVNGVIYGASDSDVLNIFNIHNISNIAPHHIVTFKDGKIIEDKDIGELGEGYMHNKMNGLYEYIYPYGYYDHFGYEDDFKYEDKSKLDVGFDLENAHADDFSIDIEGFVKEGNITYSSKWAASIYSDISDGIEDLSANGNIFIDENGVSFTNETDFMDHGTFITKCKKLKDPSSGNVLNLAKRGLKLLTDHYLLDTKNGELYETYGEWKKYGRKKE